MRQRAPPSFEIRDIFVHGTLMTLPITLATEGLFTQLTVRASIGLIVSEFMFSATSDVIPLAS